MCSQPFSVIILLSRVTSSPYIFHHLSIHVCRVIVETSHVLKRSSFPPNGFFATATGTERGEQGKGRERLGHPFLSQQACFFH